MNFRIPTAAAVLCSLSMSAGIWFAGATLSADMARADGAHAVTLADATTPPSELVYLYAGASVTYASEDDGYNCLDTRGRGRSWFTETSAYTWKGGALGAQRWNRDHTVTYWRARTGRVTFDGITFRNRSHERVLVAGWCA